MRTIKQIHNSRYSPIADLITYSPIPSSTIDQIDPFLLLNHHGLQEYPENNNGLPFGPHPHRGMETVTFIMKGDIMHKDSSGNESVIEAGGIQYMTAGSGLMHAEVSSDNFKKIGGELEILQLWLNLPAKHKMTEPYYVGIQKEDIPTLEFDNGKVKLNAISGEWEGKKGSFQSLTNIHLATMGLEKGGKFETNIPVNENVFFYILSGKLKVNGVEAGDRQLVEFENDETLVSFTAEENTEIILGHAIPYNEPVVAQGPFVMNTQEEIEQAYDDYRSGKFGNWKG